MKYDEPGSRLINQEDNKFRAPGEVLLQRIAFLTFQLDYFNLWPDIYRREASNLY